MKKVIYFVSEDWVFLNHRIDLVKKIQKKGFQVNLIAKQTHYKKIIEKEKIKFFPIKIDRGSKNIRKSIKTVFILYKIFKKINPDIIHNFGLKQIILGNLATIFLKSKKTFNSVIGLGSSFVSGNFLLKYFIINLLRFTLFFKNTYTLVQNEDDYNFFKKKIWVRKNKLYINTVSGINLKKIKSIKEPRGKIIFLFASRLLKDKGIIELIEATRKLSKINKNFELYIAGNIDSENSSSISYNQIKSWDALENISYLGYVKNINELYKKVHVSILPSYREGLPKGLLEAASNGKPIISTNVTGCKEIVINGINGITVNPKNSDEIFEAMKKMILNKKMRLKMGKKGREIIKKKFLLETTTKKLIDLYNNC